MARSFGTVSEIKKDSPAARAGLCPGDKVLAINGQRLIDIVDYQMAATEPLLKFTVKRQNQIKELTVVNNYTEPLGIKFSSSIFNKVKLCRNRCLFCFVDQLPPGLRQSLYLKDDDYRLSFLYGNFITLTNLTATDLKRILTLKLSPLYVSWQATTPAVRQALIQPAGTDNAVFHLRALAQGGIEMHMQIVLCPGYNDGSELEKSLQFLATFKQVRSVGIVPVGLSKHRDHLTKLKLVTPQQARELIKQISVKQKFFKKQKGVNWVYLADELYLLAGEKLPPVSAYDGFPQLENGIGIARRFLAAAKKGLKRKKLKELAIPKPITVLTGRLSYPLIKEVFSQLEQVSQLRFKVVAVANEWLGANVTVTGLLSGCDIMKAIKKIKQGTVFIPDICLNKDGLFLDGLSLKELKQNSACNLLVVPSEGTTFFNFLTQKNLSATGGVYA